MQEEVDVYSGVYLRGITKREDITKFMSQLIKAYTPYGLGSLKRSLHGARTITKRDDIT